MNEGHLQGSGISHLLEHLVFKGTENYSGQDLARKVQERGGHWNAYTSVNRTVFYIDGPAESWQVFLNLLTELVFSPTFPEGELEREKEVVRREMAMYADEPDSVAYQLLMQTLYLKHPGRWPVLGQPAVFDTPDQGGRAGVSRLPLCSQQCGAFNRRGCGCQGGAVPPGTAGGGFEGATSEPGTAAARAPSVRFPDGAEGVCGALFQIEPGVASALFRASGYSGAVRPGQHFGRRPFRAVL